MMWHDVDKVCSLLWCFKYSVADDAALLRYRSWWDVMLGRSEAASGVNVAPRKSEVNEKTYRD